MASSEALPTARAARAERDAHSFALNTGQPTPLRLARLHRAFELMVPAAAPPPAHRPAWLEGALALRLVLITGRDLEEIHALRIFPHAKALDPSWPATRLLQIDGHPPALWLEAGSTPHLTIRSEELRCANPASHAVWLSLDKLSERWLRLLHPRQQLTTISNTAAQGQPLFRARSSETLAEAADSFLALATSKMGGADKDYLPKVEDCARFLRQQLAVSSPGDPAASWLITRTAPKRNAATSYYSSVSLRDAQRYQFAAVAKADSRAPRAGQRTLSSPALPAVLDERAIGSRLCPSEAAITGLRDHLLERARISRGATTKNRASEIDHAFTAYSWLFFSLHAGWRPPDKLLPGAEDLDWVTGAFFLEDKLVRSGTTTAEAQEDAQRELLDEVEGEDVIGLPTAVTGGATNAAKARVGTKRRWLPLGKRVLAQLRAYHVHVAARAGKGLAAPPIEDRPGILAYLKSTPGRATDLPWNFGRHYLRSALMGKVSIEVINAYLGHWDTGAEPWANGSCLDPIAYAHEIRTALDGVFPEHDWPVITGFQ